MLFVCLFRTDSVIESSHKLIRNLEDSATEDSIRILLSDHKKFITKNKKYNTGQCIHEQIYYIDLLIASCSSYGDIDNALCNSTNTLILRLISLFNLSKNRLGEVGLIGLIGGCNNLLLLTLLVTGSQNGVSVVLSFVVAVMVMVEQVFTFIQELCCGRCWFLILIMLDSLCCVWLCLLSISCVNYTVLCPLYFSRGRENSSIVHLR
jgi:hypothetical protein